MALVGSVLTTLVSTPTPFLASASTTSGSGSASASPSSSPPSSSMISSTSSPPLLIRANIPARTRLNPREITDCFFSRFLRFAPLLLPVASPSRLGYACWLQYLHEQRGERRVSSVRCAPRINHSACLTNSRGEAKLGTSVAPARSSRANVKRVGDKRGEDK